ncbi:MAG: YabP/YqfC family sporulation protein [Eubacteriales bacterium]|nr:YabP/YqfC family sporulation protein [Eubacteriales bacterium]
MFNFFNEIKSKFKGMKDVMLPYQSVMLGNFLLYIEGFSSLMTYTRQTIVFKVKGGVITVTGKDLLVKEMSPSTITITGTISQVEYI